MSEYTHDVRWSSRKAKGEGISNSIRIEIGDAEDKDLALLAGRVISELVNGNAAPGRVRRALRPLELALNKRERLGRRKGGAGRMSVIK